MEPTTLFQIDAQLLTDVAKYLSAQPYKDVVELLNRLGTLKRVDAPQPVASPAAPQLVNN